MQMRIGDSDREAAIKRLRQFHMEGRLTVAEFEERMEAALSAKTEADLAPLFTDLPATPAQATQQAMAQSEAQPKALAKPETPWYAQWWLLFIPIALTAAYGNPYGYLIGATALWIWVIYPLLARRHRT